MPKIIAVVVPGKDAPQIKMEKDEPEEMEEMSEEMLETEDKTYTCCCPHCGKNIKLEADD